MTEKQKASAVKRLANQRAAHHPMACGCQVRFYNDGLVRLEQCPLHGMAADLHDVLKAIVTKSYLREGKHEDCHVHPKLIEAGRMLLHNLKIEEQKGK